jgi:hypothetical protein
VPQDDAAAQERVRRVGEDLDEWLQQGVDISCWGSDPKTGELEIGVRSPVAEAEPRLRARYGHEVKVYYADVRPARGL